MNNTQLAKGFQEGLTDEARAWLYRRGLTRTTVLRSKLGFVSEGRYAESISIPYLNPDGTVRTIRFRYLSNGLQKYDSLKGEKIHLYNVVNTTRPKVWLCEGEFDALILSQMGFPAVAIPGASSFKTEWRYLFVNADRVTICMDGDDAGTRAANRLASILGEVVPALHIARLPDNLDITDLYLRDPEELRNLVK